MALIKINPKPLYDLDNKQRILLWLSALILFGYSIYAIMIPPADARWRLAAKQLVAQKKLAASRQLKTRNVADVAKSFQSLQGKMFQWQQMFFSPDEADNFLNGFEGIAAAANATLTKMGQRSSLVISDSKLIAGAAYKKDIVEITLKGRYNNIEKAFEKIEGYSKLLKISRLKINKAKDDPLLVEAIFDLEVYILAKK